jgi:hypothetical protein
MMIMTKFRFIDSSRNERERKKDIVETTITEVMIFEFSKLLINIKAKMSLILTKEMMKMTKQD